MKIILSRDLRLCTVIAVFGFERFVIEQLNVLTDSYKMYKKKKQQMKKRLKVILHGTIRKNDF